MLHLASFFSLTKMPCWHVRVVLYLCPMSVIVLLNFHGVWTSHDLIRWYPPPLSRSSHRELKSIILPHHVAFYVPMWTNMHGDHQSLETWISHVLIQTESVQGEDDPLTNTQLEATIWPPSLASKCLFPNFYKSVEILLHISLISESHQNMLYK